MFKTENGRRISVLTMNTLAFTVNFAIWTMFSIIGIRIKRELGLNETEFGLLVATPILTGSLIRLPLGVLTDRYGGRIVFFIQMLLVAIPTYGLAFATQYWQYLVIGLFVGLAGGSFAIGIAYTSAWFPKEKQGTAMGIFGAGNAGAAVTNLAAPLIVVAFGWRAVPQVYSIAMLVMAVIFWFFTYPDPKHEARKLKKEHLTIGQQLAPLDRCARLAFWSGVLLCFRRLRRAGAVAAEVLHRAIRSRPEDRRLHHHVLHAAVRPDPRAGRLGLRQVGRRHGDLVGVLGLHRLPVLSFLSADDADRSRHQGRRQRRNRRRRRAVHSAGVHRRHGAGHRQGQRLPQPRRSLPGQHGLGRRPGRRDRRPGRFLAADHVRHRGRCHQRAQQRLHADVRRSRRRDDLDLGRRHATSARKFSRRTPSCAISWSKAIYSSRGWPVDAGSPTGSPDDEQFWQAAGKRIALAQSDLLDAGACSWPSRCGWSGAWSSSNCRRSASTSRPANCSGWPRCRACRVPVCGWPTRSSCPFSAAGISPCSAPCRCCCRRCGWHWRCRTRAPTTPCSWSSRCCADSAAATSRPAWPTSASSSRSGCRARRWAGMPVPAILASASCRRWCR